ncbi:MAG TPA: class I SAM-dependent methyltransferase [Solirubrobacteraceae bacterium]|nr:class I SAM-dependent methyltransferase [Solirubrobacteraceae bacterium]
MSERADTSVPAVELALRASSFANVAQEYERGRPGYPREAVDWLLGDSPLEVLDIGAGTGKLTAVLLDAGHRVTALEPLAQMRAILTQRLPQARALEGSAEELPLADASVDAIAVGAAFHWFDQRAALLEIVRVLRPAGVLALLGNGFDVSLRWVAALREILGPPALQRPGHWPSFEDLREHFAQVEDREFAHEQHIDRASLRDLASSRSSLAVMPHAQREAMLTRVDLLWEREPELIGHSETTLPWHAHVRRCRRPQ